MKRFFRFNWAQLPVAAPAREIDEQFRASLAQLGLPPEVVGLIEQQVKAGGHMLCLFRKAQIMARLLAEAARLSVVSEVHQLLAGDNIAAARSLLSAAAHEKWRTDKITPFKARFGELPLAGHTPQLAALLHAAETAHGPVKVIRALLDLDRGLSAAEAQSEQAA